MGDSPGAKAIDGEGQTAEGEPPSKRARGDAHGCAGSAAPRRTFGPPDVPDTFHRFSGKVVEVHAGQDSAGAAAAEMFARARMDSALPGAAGGCWPLILGIDFEWKPDTKRDADPGNPIALIQLACWDSVLLVRTTGCREMPCWLQEILEDGEILKVSASFDVSDKKKLKHSFGWDFDVRVGDPASFVDIAPLAQKRDLPPGMKKMAKELGVHMLKPKTIGRSNWATAGELSSLQKTYAAEDAFVTSLLLHRLWSKFPPSPSGAGSLADRALASSPVVMAAMEKHLPAVDNKVYKIHFGRLREAVRLAVESLSNAIGNGGSATVLSLYRVKTVQECLMRAESHLRPLGQSLTLSIFFLRTNEDIFRLFLTRGEWRLRIRHVEEDVEDGYNAAAEEEWEFLLRVVDLLTNYAVPGQKKADTGAFGTVFKAVPVPARAILSQSEIQRWRDSADSFMDHVQTTQSEADGMVLELRKHPKCGDVEGLLERLAATMSSALEIPEAEAKDRLVSDAKFSSFYGTLPVLQKGSDEEQVSIRSTWARARILIDSQRVAARVGAPWEEVLEKMKKVKWHRQVLAQVLALCLREDRWDWGEGAPAHEVDEASGSGTAASGEAGCPTDRADVAGAADVAVDSADQAAGVAVDVNAAAAVDVAVNSADPAGVAATAVAAAANVGVESAAQIGVAAAAAAAECAADESGGTGPQADSAAQAANLEPRAQVESDLQACLDAIVAAWPDLGSLKAPDTRKGVTGGKDGKGGKKGGKDGKGGKSSKGGKKGGKDSKGGKGGKGKGGKGKFK